MRWRPRTFAASIVAVLVLLPVTTSICLAHCEQAAALSGMEHQSAPMMACHGAPMTAAHSPSRRMGDMPATCGRDHLSITAIVSGSLPLATGLSVAWIAGVTAHSIRVFLARDRAATSPPILTSIAPADSRLIPLRL